MLYCVVTSHPIGCSINLFNHVQHWTRQTYLICSLSSGHNYRSSTLKLLWKALIHGLNHDCILFLTGCIPQAFNGDVVIHSKISPSVFASPPCTLISLQTHLNLFFILFLPLYKLCPLAGTQVLLEKCLLLNHLALFVDQWSPSKFGETTCIGLMFPRATLWVNISAFIELLRSIILLWLQYYEVACTQRERYWQTL